jgi:hypothetical protein
MKAKGFLQSFTPGATVSYMTRYGLVVRRRSFPRQVNSEGRNAPAPPSALLPSSGARLQTQSGPPGAGAPPRPAAGKGCNKSGPLSGHALYVKINCARAAAGLAFVRLPPKVARFSPSPVGALSIT